MHIVIDSKLNPRYNRRHFIFTKYLRVVFDAVSTFQRRVENLHGRLDGSLRQHQPHDVGENEVGG